MNNSEYAPLKEAVFTMMCGETDTPCIGITDAFAEGSECDRLYHGIYETIEKISAVPGLEKDAEMLQEHHFDLMKRLCMEMFDHGWTLAHERCQGHPDDCQAEAL